MGTLKDLLEAVGMAATNSVLRERLGLFVDEAQRLEKENGALKARVAQLEKEVAETRKNAAQNREAAEFVEHDGALFKRGPVGDYVKAVYCPACKISTAAPCDASPFVCSRCGWTSSFLKFHLGGVMKGLLR